MPNMKALVVFVFSMVVCAGAMAQGSYSGGLQVELKPSFAFKNDWKLSTKLSPRFLFFEGSRDQSFQGISVFERTELELVMSKKVSKNLALGMGYLIRNEEGEIIHRIIQQVGISTKSGDLSLGHRFRLDQTFYQTEANAYRFRYRFNLEKPLKRADGSLKKSYLFVSNEYFTTLQNKQVELETRIIPGLGVKLDEKNRLEFGVDYRIEKLFTSKYEQLILLNIAWLPSF